MLQDSLQVIDMYSTQLCLQQPFPAQYEQCSLSSLQGLGVVANAGSKHSHLEQKSVLTFVPQQSPPLHCVPKSKKCQKRVPDRNFTIFHQKPICSLQNTKNWAKVSREISIFELFSVLKKFVIYLRVKVKMIYRWLS